MEAWTEARALIAKDKIEQCLQLLHSVCSSNAQKEILILQARLSRLKGDSLLGEDITAKRMQLSSSALDFIQAQEEELKLAPEEYQWPDRRKARLKEKITEGYSLLDEWESKQEIAENPSERKRCELEIERLRDIINKHIDELAKM